MPRLSLLFVLFAALVVLPSPILAITYLTPTSSPGGWTGSCLDPTCATPGACVIFTGSGSSVTLVDSATVACDIHLINVNDAFWLQTAWNGQGLIQPINLTIDSIAPGGSGLNWQTVGWTLAMPLTFNLNGFNASMMYTNTKFSHYTGPSPWPQSETNVNKPFVSFRNGTITGPSFYFAHENPLDGLFWIEFVDIIMIRAPSAGAAWFVLDPGSSSSSTISAGVTYAGGQIISLVLEDPFVTSLFKDTTVTITTSASEKMRHSLMFSSLVDITQVTGFPVVAILFSGIEADYSLVTLVAADSVILSIGAQYGALLAPVDVLQPIQRVLPSTANTGQFNLRLTSGSSINRFNFENAIITAVGSPNVLTDCQYHPYSGQGSPPMTVASDSSLKWVSTSLDAPPVVINRTSLIGDSATLTLSATTTFSGEASFSNYGLGDCIMILPRLNFDPGVPSSLQTQCSLLLLNGEDGNTSLHTVEALPLSGPPPNLTVVTPSTNGFNGATFNLSLFGVFSIRPDVDSALPAIRGNASNSAVFVGWPQIGIRVEWPVDSNPPVAGVKMPLFNSSNPTSATSPSSFDAVGDPSDLYQFTISYQGTATPYQVFASLKEAVIPLPPLLPPPHDPPPVAIVPSSPTCPPPPPGFSCSGITWVSNGSVTANTSLVITSATVTVIGNLTVNGSLIFASGSTNVTIQGCLELVNGSSIVIDLSGGNGGTGNGNQITSISQAEGCPLSLTSVPVGVKQRKKGCEKASVKTADASTKNTLVLILSFDKSGCNTKWIIVGAVLGSIVLIACVVTVVVYTIVQKNRYAESREKLKATG